MSTPFSDDSLLPKAAPAMPAGPHGDEYLLRSERALWERRAAVAAEASTELMDAQKKLKNVGWTNYFGDCVEGMAVYDGLKAALASFEDDLLSHVERASALSSQCRTAGTTIEAADHDGATSLET